MKTKNLTILALWLMTAIMGAWADEVQIQQNTLSVDGIADEVSRCDGTVVKPLKTPTTGADR